MSVLDAKMASINTRKALSSGVPGHNYTDSHHTLKSLLTAADVKESTATEEAAAAHTIDRGNLCTQRRRGEDSVWTKCRPF